VADSAGLTLVRGTDARSIRTRLPVTLIVADLDALSAVRPDIPSAIDPAGDDSDAIPFLASSVLAERLRATEIELDGVPAVRSGVLDSHVMPGIGTDWILVDRLDAAALPSAGAAPNRLLIRVDESADVGAVADRIAAALGDVEVTDSASVADRIQSRPSIAALIATLWAAAALALGLGALAIVVAAIAATGARNRAGAVMRILGASRRQLRGLVVWELVPVLIIAGLAGLVLGLALPFLVAGLVDLRSFVGGTDTITPDIPLPAIVGIVLGFTAACTLAGALAVTVARRVDPASNVKIGAE